MSKKWERESQALEKIFIDLNLDEDPEKWPDFDAELKKQIQQAARGISGFGWHYYKSNGHFLGQERSFRVLLAIHAGLPAQKTAWLIGELAFTLDTVDGRYDQLLSLILRRGDKFAAALTRELIRRGDSWLYVDLALDLRHRLNLDIEFSPTFAATWAVQSGIRKENIPTQDLSTVLAWAPELFEMACMVPKDNDGLMQTAVGLVRREVLSAETVIPLVIQNLSVLSRPIERRRAWETLQKLSISDTFIRLSYRGFLEALSAGDGGVFYEELVPLLLDPADDGDARLMHVLFAAMQTTTKKARRQLMGWLINRPAPADQSLSSQVLEVLSEQDPRNDFEKERVKLERSWGVSTPDAAAPEAEVITWREAPDLWTVEPLLPSEQEQDAQLLIEELGKQLSPTTTKVHIDRALALIHRMEHREQGSAALICAGMPKTSSWRSNDFATWGKGELETEFYGKYSAIYDYEKLLLCRIREIPVLLSTPQDVSLVIKLDDLLSDLEAYGDAQVIRADLNMALKRLEIWHPDHQGPSNEQLDRLSAIQAEFHEEEKPEEEKSLKVRDWVIKILQSDSAPVGDNYDLWEFPFGGTEASEILHAVNRSEPWSPELASFILSDLGTSKEIEEAVVEAFYRGLLRSGVAQAQFMHKNESGQITGMARVADALLNLAFDEEMLSVSWLLLADIVDQSVGNGRMPAGLKRVLEVMDELAPSIFTQDGVPEEAKEITSIRQLAQQKGSSAAVKVARKIVAQIADSQGSQFETNFPGRPIAKKWWIGRNLGMPVVQDPTQEEWMNRKSISRDRLEAKIHEVLTTDNWETKNRLTSIARSVEPNAFTQVVAGVVDEVGVDSVKLARWISYALRKGDDGSSAGPRGLVSRSWPTTRCLLVWASKQPKAVRETGVFLDIALEQATEAVQAVEDGLADPRELVIPELELLVGKSEKIDFKVAQLKFWLTS